MHDFLVLAQRLENISGDCQELAHTFRFLATAITSLHEAELHGYKDRSTYTDPDRARHFQELLDFFAAVRSGVHPTDQWIAGFYYNASIMRIDACYERLLVALGQALGMVQPPKKSIKSKTDAYAEAVEGKLGLTVPFKRAKLELNRKEVNRLKHALFGQQAQDSTGDDLGNAFSAIEQLLAILEDNAVRRQLKLAYPGLASR